MYPSHHPYSAFSGGRTTMLAAAAEPPQWSWADDKIFEDALMEFPQELLSRWQHIAASLPGKSPLDAFHHYETLMLDVADIDAGLVGLPPYPELPTTSGDRKSQTERKKGKPWTIEEHKQFLLGLKIYGKSDWRGISRNLVTTRRPSQVASHAQKFFNRLNSSKKDRKRSSIHDITSFSDCPSSAASSDPQPSVPITDDGRSRSFQNNGGGAALGVDQETNAHALIPPTAPPFMYQPFPSEFGHGHSHGYGYGYDDDQGPDQFQI